MKTREGMLRPSHGGPATAIVVALLVAVAAADAGADGVIVGTRLVRAAAESHDPATAVGELVAAFATALGRAPGQ